MHWIYARWSYPYARLDISVGLIWSMPPNIIADCITVLIYYFFLIYLYLLKDMLISFTATRTLLIPSRKSRPKHVLYLQYSAENTSRVFSYGYCYSELNIFGFFSDIELLLSFEMRKLAVSNALHFLKIIFLVSFLY